AVNFFTVARMCRAVIPLMTGRRGKIINISGGGATGPRPNFTSYAASKVALVRFTEILAAEVPDIDVNAIAPGVLSSQMTDAVIAAGASAGSKELVDAAKTKASPSSNETQADDLVAFLASAQSDGITGRLISALW